MQPFNVCAMTKRNSIIGIQWEHIHTTFICLMFINLVLMSALYDSCKLRVDVYIMLYIQNPAKPNSTEQFNRLIMPRSQRYCVMTPLYLSLLSDRTLYHLIKNWFHIQYIQTGLHYQNSQLIITTELCLKSCFTQ